jgi:hypothetical protein
MTDLFFISFKATAKYVHSNIDSNHHKLCYMNTVEDILAALHDKTDLKAIQRALVVMELEADMDDYPFSWFRYPKRYTLLAYKHAFEIARCLDRRFVTGNRPNY